MTSSRPQPTLHLTSNVSALPVILDVYIYHTVHILSLCSILSQYLGMKTTLKVLTFSTTLNRYFHNVATKGQSCELLSSVLHTATDKKQAVDITSRWCSNDWCSLVIFMRVLWEYILHQTTFLGEMVWVVCRFNFNNFYNVATQAQSHELLSSLQK